MRISLNKDKFRVINIMEYLYITAPITFVFYILIHIISGLLSIALVYVTAAFLDSAVLLYESSFGKTTFIYSFVFIGIIYIFNQITNVITRFQIVHITNRMRINLKPLIIKKQAGFQYKLMEDPATLDLINMINENMENRFLGFLTDCSNIIKLFIQVAGILMILFMQVWWGVIVLLITAIPMLMLALKSGAAIYEMDRKVTYLTRFMDYLSEVLSNREAGAERALFGFTGYLNDQFKKVHTKRTNLNTKVIALWVSKTQISTIILYVFTVIVAGILMTSVSSGNLSAGLYISIVGSLLSLVRSLCGTVAQIFYNYASYKEYCKDFTKYLKLKGDDEDLIYTQKQIKFNRLECINVSFKYDNTEKYIIKNLNLLIEEGKSYSLVGRNGAGKTTLTKILTGLYSEYEGTILLNGIDLKEYEKNDLKNIFSIIYQDFARYSISVKDNLFFGEQKGQYQENIYYKELQEVINKLPDLENTHLGKIFEDGVDISGGEWQRLAITRALLKDTDVIILDEPTSSLSPIAESELYSSFSEITKMKTSLLISHRLGATKITDVILVLDDGKIAEAGSHEELVLQKGIYYQMFESQRSWYSE